MNYLEKQTTGLAKEQVKEALVRMNKLNLYENVIREFEEEGVINLSENGGILFWLDEEEEKIVRDFEEQYESIVYHVIKNNTEFGMLLSLLYVSKYKEEWEDDNTMLDEGMSMVYVKNLDFEDFSEFGTIGIKQRIGGLVRTF